MPLLVISAAEVAQVTREIPASVFCDMLGTTMNAVSNHRPVAEAIPAIQNPQRTSTESEHHRFLYMPSRLATPAQGSATSIKVVAAPKPDCTIPGLPASTLLMDEETGRISAIVNASELTGIRTAAASALATKILANPESKTLVVFGAGNQAYWHARLILDLFPSVEKAQFVVRKPSPRSEALLERIKSEYPQVASGVSTQEGASEVTQRADIICTCVPSTTPLFAVTDLKVGVHINAIGSYTPSMFEFPPSLISPSTAQIPTILVDSREACLHEAGELIESGIKGEKLIEIGELCDADGKLKQDAETRVKLGRLRRPEGERSLFKCVGVGAMDGAVTRLVVQVAKERGLGKLVDF
ncbi:uncharacterized protein JCM6883_003568 [Sporobolomyces salmoneus]|uniref:uncharacterized protein n=1 Tax=Sporobolomyces salmoneus TaxID=183962 RepID=UPI00318286EE